MNYGLLVFRYRLNCAFRNLGFYQQALYCFRKIYSLDPSNVDALWDRATLAKEIGELRIVCSVLRLNDY